MLTLSKKPPVASDLARLIAAIDAALAAMPDVRAVLLAVSGGGDSMAMAHAFSQWKSDNPSAPPLRALIVNHGVRRGAGDEAATVKARLEAIGIRADIAAIKNPPSRVNQANLRRARYNLLAGAAAPDDAVIVTAHHADDQAETVAMRLGRDSGLHGLGGMRPLSVLSGIRILRPFLALRRDTLRAALAASGLDAVEDPSNADRRFERVRVRHALARGNAQYDTMPLLRLAAASAHITDALAHAIGETMQGRMALTPQGWGWIDHVAYAALPQVAREVLLSGLLRGLAPWDAPPVKKAAIRRLDAAVGQSRRVTTLGGCEWVCDGGRITAYPEAENPPQAMPLDSGQHSVVFDGRWRVFLPRTIPPGARLEALGRERSAEMRRGGHFSGIPARALWRLPFLAASSLENGGFIPHLIKDGTGARIRTEPAMYFTGLRHSGLFGDW